VRGLERERERERERAREMPILWYKQLEKRLLKLAQLLLSTRQVQNVWPGCNWRGVCMLNSGADNFVVRFPEGAGAQEKALLVAGVFLHNFVYWESRNNQK
jgi:hypothetical protein